MLSALMLMAGLARGAQAIPPPPVLPSVLPPGDLAFGLERLHWGMTPPEARGFYPALDGNPAEPGQPSSTLSLADYPAAGCKFTVTLNFDRGRLSGVDLDSNGTAHLKMCGDRMKAALLSQYGGEPGGFSNAPNPHGYSEYGTWGGPVTEVVYAALRDGFIEIHFTRTPR
jgi:hypothetical protein